MECKRAKSLLDGYVDDELDLVTHLEMEQHVQDCPTCGTARRQRLHLRAAIQNAKLFVESPPALRPRIDAALRHKRQFLVAPSRWALAVAACLLLSLGFVSLLWQYVEHRNVQLAVADQVISNHVRSLMAEHLADVLSTDQHTVKPWFAGKVDFSPEVKDFSAQGFELVGGRLDYLDNRTVAAMIYRHHKHVINVFVWPSEQSAGEAKAIARHGYHIVHWTTGGLNYWMVSDLNAVELNQFGMLLRGS